MAGRAARARRQPSGVPATAPSRAGPLPRRAARPQGRRLGLRSCPRRGSRAASPTAGPTSSASTIHRGWTPSSWRRRGPTASVACSSSGRASRTWAPGCATTSSPGPGAVSPSSREPRTSSTPPGGRSPCSPPSACLAVAGEGRLSDHEGRILPLETGLAHFAMLAGAPIVPTAIVGTRWVHLGCRVSIRIGEPVHPADVRAGQAGGSRDDRPRPGASRGDARGRRRSRPSRLVRSDPLGGVQRPSLAGRDARGEPAHTLRAPRHRDR